MKWGAGLGGWWWRKWQMQWSGDIVYLLQTPGMQTLNPGLSLVEKSKKLKKQWKIPWFAGILFELSKRKKSAWVLAFFDLVLLKQTDIIVTHDLYTHIYNPHLHKLLSLLCPLKLQPLKIRAVLFFTTGSLSPASDLLPRHSLLCSVSGSSELSGSRCCTLWFKILCVFLSLPASLWFTYRGIHYWSHFGCCS